MRGKDAEERTCWPAAYDSNVSAIIQSKLPVPLLCIIHERTFGGNNQDE
jgi:hypothetical protein